MLKLNNVIYEAFNHRYVVETKDIVYFVDLDEREITYWDFRDCDDDEIVETQFVEEQDYFDEIVFALLQYLANND